MIGVDSQTHTGSLPAIPAPDPQALDAGYALRLPVLPSFRTGPLPHRTPAPACVPSGVGREAGSHPDMLLTPLGWRRALLPFPWWATGSGCRWQYSSQRLMEGFSFRTAIKESNRTRGKRTWSQYVRRAKARELPVVLLEDFAALVRLVFALLGVGLTLVTHNGIWDAVGTAMIDLLLVTVAVVLAVEMHGRARHRQSHPPAHPAHRPGRGSRGRQDRGGSRRHRRGRRRRDQRGRGQVS
jgi:hypothetical protein